MFGPTSARKKLESDQLQFGLFLNTVSPTVTEIAARAGFDILMLDHEHGPGTVPDAIACMNAARGSDTEIWIRVPGNDIVYAKQYLDAGADGIMCPMINSAEEARRFVSYCHYPPYGIRGLATGATRHSSYGYYRDEYLARVRDDLSVLVQIETVQAVEQVEEIAAVDGVNILFVGPMDLSGCLGHLGEYNHPLVLDAMRKIEAAAHKHNKVLGTLYMPGMDLQGLLQRGYKFILGGGDLGIIRTGMQGMVKSLHKAAEDARAA
jgi:2-keto-3-deoxy-L-rhamnonate aldolase RhmA